MNNETKGYYDDCKRIMIAVLNSYFFDLPEDSVRDDLIKLKEILGNYLRIALILQDEGIGNTEYEFEHVHMMYAIYCEMRRQDTLSFEVLDYGRIEKKFQEDSKESTDE